MQLLSRLFNPAIERGVIRSNPCKEGKLFCKYNQGTRQLSPEKEVRLMPYLTGSRADLRDILTLSLYTGMRRTEILTLHKGQIGFLRDSIELTKTKSDRPRSIPICSAPKPILQRLCNDVRESGHLFENPKTSNQSRQLKRLGGKRCVMLEYPI